MCNTIDVQTLLGLTILISIIPPIPHLPSYSITKYLTSHIATYLFLFRRFSNHELITYLPFQPPHNFLTLPQPFYQSFSTYHCLPGLIYILIYRFSPFLLLPFFVSNLETFIFIIITWNF